VAAAFAPEEARLGSDLVVELSTGLGDEQDA